MSSAAGGNVVVDYRTPAQEGAAAPASARAKGKGGPFLVASGLLLVSALLLTSVTEGLQLHFKKQAVPIERPLTEVPAELGPWRLISQDLPLPGEIEHELGTKQYIFREYVDARLVDAATLEKLAARPEMQFEREERGRALAGLYIARPQAIVKLAVTYYTGMVDTVAHIPDRCYVADAFGIAKNDKVTWASLPGGGTVDARMLRMEDNSAARRPPVNVAYFFRVNDTYKPDPLGVRLRLQDLREKYGFYAKVELMNMVPDTAKASEVMEEFLTHAMPEVAKSFPDWERVNGRK